MKSSLRKSAFTLFELVVVMGVVALLSSVSYISLRGIQTERSIEGAQGTLHSLLQATRAQAILKGTNARLIISFDASDPDRFLKFAGIIIEEELESETWVAVNRGVSFPVGSFFVPKVGDENGVTFSGEWEDLNPRSEYKESNSAPVESTADMTLVFPRKDAALESEAGAPDWRYFEFGPNGRLTKAQQSSRIVISVGKNAEAGELEFYDVQKTVAVILRQNGSMMQTSELEILEPEEEDP